MGDVSGSSLLAFAAISLLCGLASSLGMLLGARVLLGLFGGPIMPLSQMQVTLLGLTILIPTVLIALLLIRRQTLVPNQLRAP